MSGYVLSPRAEGDLEEIWDYTTLRWSPTQAEAYHAGIFAALERLAETPTLGRDYSQIRFGYRRYNIKSHVIFYRIENDVVRVIRVLHQSRDFPRYL